MKRFRRILSLFFFLILVWMPFGYALAEDAPPIMPENIQLNETLVAKNVGDEFLLQATVMPDNATDKTVYWASQNPDIASVTPEGKVQCLNEGSTIITATTVNGKLTSCEVKVASVIGKGLSLPKSLTLGVKETKAIEAIFNPLNTTNKNLLWSSSNKRIATVANGQVTGLRKGVVTITAKMYNGKKATCKVKVIEIQVKSVTLDVTSYKGKKGECFVLKADILPENATNKKITWTSSNKNVAKVTADGTVTLMGAGKATITAITKNKKKAFCIVTCTSQFDSSHYYQGDRQWRFPRRVRKNACVITSFAILLDNAGINATPRSVYNICSSTSLRYNRLMSTFGVKMVNALSDSSPYLENFNGYETYIKDPAVNYVAAIKEALDRNPEGVCAYFVKGNNAHMIVAIGYEGDEIYYSDPGRVFTRGFEVNFTRTWTYYKHKMTYKNLCYLVALDIQ